MLLFTILAILIVGRYLSKHIFNVLMLLKLALSQNCRFVFIVFSIYLVFISLDTLIGVCFDK